MKKTLFLSLFFLVSFSTYAQDVKKQSSLTISIGPSIPTGEFADKNLYDEKAGLASVGSYASVSYNYQFSRFFGAVAAIDGRIHGVDEDALQMYTLPTGSGSSISLKTSTWRFLRTMVGISQTIPITNDEKLSLEIRELVGMQFSTSPEIQISGFIPGVGSLNSVEESQTVNSLALGLGFGFKYRIGDKLGLRLFGDYQGASPKFSYDDYSTGNAIENKIVQKTTSLSIGLGLAIGF